MAYAIVILSPCSPYCRVSIDGYMYSPFLTPPVAVVEFEESAYTVSEDDGEVEVCLRMSGMISTPAVVQLLAIPVTAEGILKN